MLIFFLLDDLLFIKLKVDKGYFIFYVKMGLKCVSYLGLFKYVINYYCLFILFVDIIYKVGVCLYYIFR